MKRTIFQEGNSVVHRLNPATTIVVSICLSIFVFLVPDYRVAGAVSVLLLAASVIAGVHHLIVKLTAVAVVPLAVFLFIIRGILVTGSGNTTPWMTVGTITIWWEGVALTRLITLRVTAFVLAFLLLATTVHPQKMRVSLIEKGVPPKLAYLVLAAFQTAPEIINRAQDISVAQRSRGLDTKASIVERFRSLSALLVPLMISSLILANTRALALSARGFDRTNALTFWHDVPDTAAERIIRLVAIAAVCVTAAVRAVTVLT